MDINADMLLLAPRTGVHLGDACLLTVLETSSFTNTKYPCTVSKNNSYSLKFGLIFQNRKHNLFQVMTYFSACELYSCVAKPSHIYTDVCMYVYTIFVH